jgi:hypothetical protein
MPGAYLVMGICEWECLIFELLRSMRPRCQNMVSGLVEVGCGLATGGTFGRVENGNSLPFAALYAVVYVKMDTPFRDGNAIVSCKDLGFVSSSQPSTLMALVLKLVRYYS